MRHVGYKVVAEYLRFGKLARKGVDIVLYNIERVVIFVGVGRGEFCGKIAARHALNSVKNLVYRLVHRIFAAQIVHKRADKRKYHYNGKHYSCYDRVVAAACFRYGSVDEHARHYYCRRKQKKADVSGYGYHSLTFFIHFNTALYPRPRIVTISNPSQTAVFSRSFAMVTSTVREVAELS